MTAKLSSRRAGARRPKPVKPAVSPAGAAGRNVLLLPEHATGGLLRRVAIRFHAREARVVVITGSFTNWAINREQMRPEGDGWWGAELQLPPGRHEYRFIVDGQWTNGPSPFGYVANAFGTSNCLLDVP